MNKQKMTVIPTNGRLLIRGEVDDYPVMDLKNADAGKGLNFSRFVVEAIAKEGIPEDSPIKVGDSIMVEKHVLMGSVSESGTLFNQFMIQCDYNNNRANELRSNIDSLSKQDYQKVMNDKWSIAEHFLVSYHDVRGIFSVYKQDPNCIPFALKGSSGSEDTADYTDKTINPDEVILTPKVN